MGNHRFKLSDMMPNSWFSKLKDMSKPRKKQSKKKKQPPFASSSPTAKIFTESSKPKPQLPHQLHYPPRQSYYFTRELTSPAPAPSHGCPTSSSPTNDPPPKKSNRQKPRNRTTTLPPSDPNLLTSSASAGCGCRSTTIESVWTRSQSPPETGSSSSFDSSPDPPSETEFLDDDEPEFRCDRVLSAYHVDSGEKDVVVDVEKASLAMKLSDVRISDAPGDGLDSFSGLELPPIITKPAKFSEMVSEVKKNKNKKKEQRNITNSTGRRLPSSNAATSPGFRLRNSPRISHRKINQACLSRRSVLSNSSSKRRSISDSFVIVKSSFDPQRDFRESMVEMILENNIKASKDLEDLLACYLSLNSDEYHEMIIKVFKQIWFDLTDIGSK